MHHPLLCCGADTTTATHFTDRMVEAEGTWVDPRPGSPSHCFTQMLPLPHPGPRAAEGGLAPVTISPVPLRSPSAQLC